MRHPDLRTNRLMTTTIRQVFDRFRLKVAIWSMRLEKGVVVKCRKFYQGSNGKRGLQLCTSGRARRSIRRTFPYRTALSQVGDLTEANYEKLRLPTACRRPPRTALRTLAEGTGSTHLMDYLPVAWFCEARD